MKNVIAILLVLLGVVEIFYGIVWGRLRIYAHEAPFAQALRLQDLSADQVQAYNKYIELFQDEWRILAVFGALTIGAAAALWVADKKKA